MKPIIEFDKTFAEIPQQDNPAYGKEACLMIVKSGNDAKNNGAQWMVIEIIPVDNPYEEDSIWRRGMFWQIENARLFAQTQANKNFFQSDVMRICFSSGYENGYSDCQQMDNTQEQTFNEWKEKHFA